MQGNKLRTLVRYLLFCTVAVGYNRRIYVCFCIHSVTQNALVSLVFLLLALIQFYWRNPAISIFCSTFRLTGGCCYRKIVQVNATILVFQRVLLIRLSSVDMSTLNLLLYFVNRFWKYSGSIEVK